MKKALALLICVLFVLTTNSFALWGIGEKSTKEAKTKVETKVKKEAVKKKVVVKKLIVKKVKKVKKTEKKGAIPAVPPKK